MSYGVRAPLPKVAIRGVAFHALREQECIDHLLTQSESGQGGWVVTANLDHMRRLLHDSSYADLCRGADLIVADGMPLVWASRVQGTPLPERVAGSSLVSTLSGNAAARGRSIFLLGGNPGSAEAAAEVLRERHPAIRIAGFCCPPIGFEKNPDEMAKLRSQLLDAQPDIIYVALGSPKQERLIAQLRHELPGAWWMGVGISFSFLCGQVRRAPEWMQRSGLEWLHRLCQEPRRLAKRYLVQGVPFALSLIGGLAVRRALTPGMSGRHAGGMN